MSRRGPVFPPVKPDRVSQEQGNTGPAPGLLTQNPRDEGPGKLSLARSPLRTPRRDQAILGNNGLKEHDVGWAQAPRRRKNARARVSCQIGAGPQFLVPSTERRWGGPPPGGPRRGAAPATRSGNGPRSPFLQGPRFLPGGAPEQVTRPPRTSVSPSGTQRPHGAGGRGSGSPAPLRHRRQAPPRKPPQGPCRQRRGSVSSSGPVRRRTQERSRRPPPGSGLGAHRQTRHDLDGAAVAKVPSGLRRRLSHGRRRLLLRAARPPRGVRRRPFATLSPADEPAHAHAGHAQRMGRSGERGSRSGGAHSGRWPGRRWPPRGKLGAGASGAGLWSEGRGLNGARSSFF